MVVIGIHAPEFGFERDPANVKIAVSDLNVTYPIPIDSNHSIWTSFRNEYWPANYFIDARDGFVITTLAKVNTTSPSA